jgi:hypothetical protein
MVGSSSISRTRIAIRFLASRAGTLATDMVKKA